MLSALQILDAVLYVYAVRHGLSASSIQRLGIQTLEQAHVETIGTIVPPSATLYDLVFLYEFLLPTTLKAEKGITFTPDFISSHIVKSVIGDNPEEAAIKRIIDPSCGLGVFLLSTLYYLHNLTGKSAWSILKDNIFGLDIVEANVDMARKILGIACYELDPRARSQEALVSNIRCCDSLKIDWCEEFGGEKFHGVVGNPPYINPHDLPAGVKEFLKSHFSTTTLGTTNIYYAFIEHGMKFVGANGSLSYIIPNNFITITAAKDLRMFMVRNAYIARLIDFTDNMIFAPVRTYNAIITLDHYHPMSDVDSCRDATWIVLCDGGS